MRQEVESKLANHTKDSVKDNPVLRKQVADEAAAIMARMGAFMGGV
jgi:hypothetical protein